MPLAAPFTIDLGFVRAYLVPTADGGCVLVDAGYPKQEGKILAAMASLGLPPNSLRLIVVTHAHGDHMGSVAAVAKATGAPILAQRAEVPALNEGAKLPIRGLSAIGTIVAALTTLAARSTTYPAYPVDIIVDEERSLADFGVAGRVIHTPGHSPGSLALLLDDGDVFVGDLCAKMPILRAGSYLPFIGNDRDTIYASWRRLLAAGAKRFHSGHGAAPIPAEALQAELDRDRPLP